MDGELDYTKYEESELVEMFGRMDPRYAPVNCARLKELLAERGYVIRDGGLGPGSAVPSPEKLQAFIGSPHPIRCRVKFDRTTGLFRWLEPAHNDFGFVGSGALEADGINVWISGRRAAGVVLGPFLSLFQHREELSWRGIVDVESDGSLVGFKYHAPDSRDRAITVWLPDSSAAEQLAAVLPRQRTAEFRPQLKGYAEFEDHLIAQSTQTPVTIALVTINALVFLATAIAGAGWLIPNGSVQVAWGSNFGPYTTDGEWWRLLTSLFIHFGIIHLMFNMWALASFGPLIERLFGSVNYLSIYLIAGMTGSLASISWRPDINSAGASGAIFGILGALLAAQVRAGETFPSSILRPLRNSTLLFTSCALLAGFAHTGIDNAAHLGGIGAGFFIGLVMARPVTGERSYTRSDMRRFLQMVPVAAVLLAVGLWFAQQASASLGGEGLYWHTIHWFGPRERRANIKFNAALALFKADPQNQLALANRLESDVLPFWREAVTRITAVHLPPNSPQAPNLEFLQNISTGRVTGYELFALALQTNDRKTAASAQREMKRIDDLIQERNATDGRTP